MSLFNVIFWVIGGTLLGLSIWVLVDPESFPYLDVMGSNSIYVEIALYVVIAAGGVIFLVGILGCLGACTGSKLILVLYGVFVIIAVLAEIAAITLVAIFYANMDEVGDAMQKDVQDNYVSETSSSSISVSWNSMQIQWQCCGSYDYKDYVGSKFAQNAAPGVSVPWTCCVMKSDDVNPIYATKDDVLNPAGCQLEAAGINTDIPYLNKGGCYIDLKDVMDLAAPITLGVLSGFVVIQLIGLGMSCALRKKKNQDVAPSGGKMI